MTDREMIRMENLFDSVISNMKNEAKNEAKREGIRDGKKQVYVELLEKFRLNELSKRIDMEPTEILDKLNYK